ncbi:MAG: Lrp/AsnC family transcriptional regulator [Oscillospiraceae bacterium]|nr:Lrp/AsnC family transcriptional regulator [Oscillospiraceae bacterium]
MNKLLDLLRQNARLTNAELAAMLGTTENEVAEQIKQLESDGIIMGYSAIINEEKADEKGVTAIIEIRVTPIKDQGYDDLAHTIMEYEEVDSVFLMSGAYDLSVTITGTSLRKVALFVSEQLAVLDGVLSTTTHFVLRRYKEKKHLFNEDNFDERSMVSP